MLPLRYGLFLFLVPFSRCWLSIIIQTDWPPILCSLRIKNDKMICAESLSTMVHFRLTCVFVVFVVAGLVAGCDFTPDFAEFNQQESESTEKQACGGDGILCNVVGVAGVAGSEGLGGPALSAQLNHPVDVAMAPLTLAQTGEIYIVDGNNHAVRKLTPDGSLFPFIGSGVMGDRSEGPAEQLELSFPSELTVGPDGNFYVSHKAQTTRTRIRGITMEGKGYFGNSQGLGGDGGPADQALLNFASSVTFDPDGNIYITDQGNQRLRQIDLQEIISTYTGTGAGYADGIKEDALFNFTFKEGEKAEPGGKISMNTHDWALYIADTENHSIRRINFFTGQVTTVIGTGEPGYSGDGGSARTAQLNHPTDVIFREDHHIYIADSGNHVIRKVDPFGTITTIAGTGEPGFSPDSTVATQAQLNSPRGLYYDEINHVLYFADTYNHQIKRLEDF